MGREEQCRVKVMFLMASQPPNLLKLYNKQKDTFLQYLELCLKSTTKCWMETFQFFSLWQKHYSNSLQGFLPCPDRAWCEYVRLLMSVSGLGGIFWIFREELHGTSSFHCLCSEWKYQDPFAAARCSLHQHRLIPNAKQEKMNQKRISQLL